VSANLRNVEVSQLVHPPRDEDVGTLEIPMKYASFVQLLETTEDVQGHPPDLLLGNGGPLIATVRYSVEQISSI
jgi:hypothetical protein